MSKRYAFPAIVLTTMTALPASAQQYDYNDGSGSGSGYEESYSSFGDSRSSGSSSSQGSQSDQPMPPPGEPTSLDGFDSLMDGLNEQVNTRLEQLEVNGGGSESDSDGSLPGPDISSYQGDLDQMAASQRQIKLLEVKLRQAELAKQVWQTIHKDPNEQIAKLKAEQQEALAAVQDDIAAIEEERTAIEQELENAESENAQLEDEIMSLERRLVQAENANYSQSGGSSGGGQVPTSYEPAEPEPTLPSVRSLSITGARTSAELTYPDGGTVDATPGTELRDGYVVETISKSGVSVSKDGESERLSRASSSGSTSSSPSGGSSMGGMGGASSGYSSNALQNTADYVN